jgi:hypothetical protein
MRRFTAILLLISLTSGCVSYVRGGPPRTGSQVRLELTEEGSLRLGSVIGQRAQSLTGVLIAREDTAWVLRVSEVNRRGGVLEPWSGERVIVPVTAAQTPESRRLSFRKTALLVGGILAGAAMMSAVGGFDWIGGGQTSGGSSNGR